MFTKSETEKRRPIICDSCGTKMVFADEALMKQILKADGANGGEYGEAMQVYTAILAKSERAREVGSQLLHGSSTRPKGPDNRPLAVISTQPRHDPSANK